MHETQLGKRKGVVTFKGNPLTLVGHEVKEGQKKGEFVVTDENLQPFQSSSLNGKTTLIMSLPSIDTPVCEKESRHFNKELAQFGKKLSTIVISMDLPFAQKRWCAAEGVKELKFFSDYHHHKFGEQYGLYIEELGLLARAVILIDDKGVIRYMEIVKEVTEEPNYTQLMQKIRQLVG